MTKIAFVCDWGESSADILARYSRQTPSQSGVWKSIEGIKSPDSADVVVVLGGSKVQYKNAETILVIREPDFIRIPDLNGYKHVINWEETYCGVTWWLSKTYDELVGMPLPKKELKVSCIASSKHQHRNLFIEQLVLRKPWQIWRKEGLVDLFGRGHDTDGYGDVYKGSIESNGNCKLDGLLPYEFNIVLENSQQHNYWTEKLADAYLAWCFPIYWGCPNALDFFDPNSLLLIDSNTTYSDIARIAQQPITNDMTQSLAESRLKILNQYNIWETIHRKIESI